MEVVAALIVDVLSGEDFELAGEHSGPCVAELVAFHTYYLHPIVRIVMN